MGTPPQPHAAAVAVAISGMKPERAAENWYPMEAPEVLRAGQHVVQNREVNDVDEDHQ